MQRTEQIRMRLSKAELDQIRTQAKEFDMPISRYIRELALFGYEQRKGEQSEKFRKLAAAKVAQKADFFQELNKTILDTQSRLESQLNTIFVDSDSMKKKRSAKRSK